VRCVTCFREHRGQHVGSQPMPISLAKRGWVRQTPRSWDEFHDVPPRLGRHYRAIAMDTVGFGDSDALAFEENSIQTWSAPLTCSMCWSCGKPLSSAITRERPSQSRWRQQSPGGLRRWHFPRRPMSMPSDARGPKTARSSTKHREGRTAAISGRARWTLELLADTHHGLDREFPVAPSSRIPDSDNRSERRL
jgi:hypothetical protein